MANTPSSPDNAVPADIQALGYTRVPDVLLLFQEQLEITNDGLWFLLIVMSAPEGTDLSDRALAIRFGRSMAHIDRMSHSVMWKSLATSVDLDGPNGDQITRYDLANLWDALRRLIAFTSHRSGGAS